MFNSRCERLAEGKGCRFELPEQLEEPELVCETRIGVKHPAECRRTALALPFDEPGGLRQCGRFAAFLR